MLQSLLSCYDRGQIPQLQAEGPDSHVFIPVDLSVDPVAMSADEVTAVQPSDSTSTAAVSTEQQRELQTTSTAQPVEDLSPTKEYSSVGFNDEGRNLTKRGTTSGGEGESPSKKRNRRN